MCEPDRRTLTDTVVADGRMVVRICLPLLSLWTALRSGWRPSPHPHSLRIDQSRPRTMQQKNDKYGLENDDKMQTCSSWSMSRAVPMSCTALEMRCDAENDIQMQVGAAADDIALASVANRLLAFMPLPTVTSKKTRSSLRPTPWTTRKTPRPGARLGVARRNAKAYGYKVVALCLTTLRDRRHAWPVHACDAQLPPCS